MTLSRRNFLAAATAGVANYLVEFMPASYARLHKL